ncbi:hypothetical protein JCM19992_02500 [Thermostilla marina]
MVVAAASAVHAERRGVRLSWGGGTPTAWQIGVSLEGGRVVAFEPLGTEPDEPGSMVLQNGRLIVLSPAPRAFDAVDLEIEAPADAVLQVDARNGSNPQVVHRVVLGRLDQEDFQQNLDESGNRLYVQRIPGDRLHISTDRPLIFRPGETAQFTIEPRGLNVPATERIRIQIDVFPARSRIKTSSRGLERLSEVDLGNLSLPQVKLGEMGLIRPKNAGPLNSVQYEIVPAQTPSLPVQIPLPSAEGAYDLRITAQRKRGPLAEAVGQPLARGSLPAERIVQVLVLGDEFVTDQAAGGALSLVGEPIDAASPDFWQRLAKLPEELQAWKFLRNESLPSGSRRTRKHPLGELVELPPSPSDDYAWEAYSLPVREPGKPHIVEIAYPSDVEQTLAYSVLEPNAAGAIHPLGVDGGITVRREPGDTSPPAWKRHRFVFWPKTTKPVLLLVNQRRDVPAVYGRISVYAGWEHLPPAFPRQGPAPERFHGVYLHRPLFAEIFNAEDAPGPFSTQGIDDWVTFYQGGTRLVEYLRFAGYNGAVVTVFSEGSTLYPSELLEPAPRYDTGVFCETGCDPVRKDVLEMLLRLFDREGLQMIPAMDFSTPLPALEEAIRREGRPDSPLRWIGPHGKPLTAGITPTHGMAPYYNILDPRVQEAVLAVVHELVDRYGSHPSFRGLAVQLTSQGYLVLPGPEWGLDDETVARFSEETGIRIPDSGGPDRFAQRAHLLLGEYRQAWLRWRAQRVHSLLTRIHHEMTAARPDGKLLVLGGTLFSASEWSNRLRPSLEDAPSADEVFLELGLDAQTMATQPGIVFLRPKRLFEDRPGLDPVEFEIERLFGRFDWRQQSSTPGFLFFHLPNEFHVASFDRRSPVQPTFTWLLTQPLPADYRNRRRFVQALAELDAHWLCDGGWRVPIGEEEALRPLVAAYRQLPGIPFRTFVPASGTTQPVVLRYARHGNHTYAYIVNEAPFPVTFSIALRAPPAVRVEELTGTRTIADLERAGEAVRWQVTLDAYDLLAVRFDSPLIDFADPRVRWSEDVDADLRRRIAEISDRAATLRSPPLLDAPVNAGFDQVPGPEGNLPGWEIYTSRNTRVTLDAEQKRAGAYALKLESNGDPVAVLSGEIPAPKTGRLTISMWLRTADPSGRVPLRVFIEGRHGDRPLVRYAEIGVSDTGRPVPQIGPDWAPVMVEVKDLPANNLSPLRIRLALAGKGVVWIDDLRLCDLAFSKSERVALFKRIAPAEAKYSEGEIADCLRVLDDYWARYLMANVPPSGLVSTIPPEPNKPATPKAEEEPPDRSARLWDRLRGVLPDRLLRF